MKSYVVGFILSLFLTLAAAGVLYAHEWSGHTLFTHASMYGYVLVLALVQLAVQLYFFLHVGKPDRSRDQVALIAFTGMVVVILVGGSLWIMYNLSHTAHVPSGHEMEQYMLDQ